MLERRDTPQKKLITAVSAHDAAPSRHGQPRSRMTAEIAKTLFVSEATVRTHVAHILAKLQLRDRAQAVVLAYESGLATPGMFEEG